MKIRKPDDEKYFKDIVLNDILEEISNENGTTPKHTKKTKKQTLSGKKIFFILLGLFFIAFIVIVLKFVTDATTEEKEIPKKITLDTQKWKMEKKSIGDNKLIETQIMKKKSISKPVIQSKTIVIKPKENKSKPVQKSERELAKEALKQQMLN